MVLVNSGVYLPRRTHISFFLLILNIFLVPTFSPVTTNPSLVSVVRNHCPLLITYPLIISYLGSTKTPLILTWSVYEALSIPRIRGFTCYTEDTKVTSHVRAHTFLLYNLTTFHSYTIVLVSYKIHISFNWYALYFYADYSISFHCVLVLNSIAWSHTWRMEV